MSALIGGGLPSFWQLPDWHKFQPAFVMHDAGQDAIDIFLGKAEIANFSTQEYPIEYPLFVLSQLEKLKIIFKRSFNRKDAVKQFVSRIDKEFRDTCNKLVDTRFQKFQAWMFYRLVKFYSKYKY